MTRSKGLRQWLQWLMPQYDYCIICDKSNMQSSAVSSRAEKGQAAINPRNKESRSFNTSTGFMPLSTLGLQRYICVDCLAEIAWIDKILCVYCGRRERCPDCSRRQQLALWLNRSAVSYTSAMKQWLHRYKFQGDERLAGLFGMMLLPAVDQVTLQLIYKYGLEQQWKDSSKTPANWLKHYRNYYWDAVTAVPLSEERQRERGFNQAERLAAVISERAAIPYYELLVRTKHSTVRHSHQNRQQRIQASEVHYSCSVAMWNALLRDVRKAKPQADSLHILLVDDVYTTGSTIHACAEALLRASPCSLVVASVTWARS